VKKHAVTIVLVLSFVALVVWLWLDRDRVTDGERKRRENSAFVAWRREELTQITVVHEGETLILQRDPRADKSLTQGKEGAWRMVSPREERADPVAVERLLSTLELAAVLRKASSGAALGLDAPRATGAVRMGDLDVPFVLGAVSPQPEGSSYFRVGDEPPVVVSKEVATELLASSDVYRDRAVVPYLATELRRFEARRPGGSFTLERLDDRSFRVAESGVLASRVALERVWAALAEMRAEAFPKDADVDRLTARPRVTLVLTPKDTAKPPAELVIGEACPGHPADVIVLRRAPSRVAACAPKDIVDALVVEASSLTERHLFTTKMDEIEELVLTRTGGDAGAPGAAALEIARKGTGYHQRAPVDRDLSSAEAEAATELLTRIASSEASAVARGGVAAPPFAAAARATVRSGDHEESIDVGAPGEGGRATLRRVLDDARLEVDAAVVRRLLPRETSVRPRVALEGEMRRAARVLLRCGVEQELVDRGEGLRLASPAGYETDGAIVQLVDGVLRGRVDTWVADTDDGHFGFMPGGCRMVITFEDGNAPVTLLFGGEGEGGVYARIESRSGVMVAPGALRELAGRIYVSRASLRVDAARIERVRVVSNGAVVTAREPSALAAAVSMLSADRVVSLKRDAGAPDLLVEVSVGESGPARQIACRAVSATERHCVTSGVNATFAVPEARLSQLLPPREAGASGHPGEAVDGGAGRVDRDGGARGDASP
jgi:hypothetical protein